ncbi:hypothetical protein [Algibacter sp. PT7-4]|uniref:hypothetical protein n=1 Tax=Algibacter ulvanivorans TaxID=3400999 RepID=UPI003AADB2BD
MNCSFSTTYPKYLPEILANTPTLFVPKILKSIETLQPNNENLFFYYQDYVFLQRKLKQDYKTDVNHPKLHTIREDKNNRWKTGNLIHFYIYTRTKNQHLFAPVLKCKAIQNIEIVWHDPDGLKTPIPRVYINNRWIVGLQLEALVRNDGFKSIEAFFAYFNTSFKGKIIHWTDLRY